VAAHAQRVAGDESLAAVRIMAINAPHAGGVHLAPHECGEFVIFFVDLAIGIKCIRTVDDAGLVMIEVGFAG